MTNPNPMPSSPSGSDPRKTQGLIFALVALVIAVVVVLGGILFFLPKKPAASGGQPTASPVALTNPTSGETPQTRSSTEDAALVEKEKGLDAEQLRIRLAEIRRKKNLLEAEVHNLNTKLDASEVQPNGSEAQVDTLRKQLEDLSRLLYGLLIAVVIGIAAGIAGVVYRRKISPYARMYWRKLFKEPGMKDDPYGELKDILLTLRNEREHLLLISKKTTDEAKAEGIKVVEVRAIVKRVIDIASSVSPDFYRGLNGWDQKIDQLQNDLKEVGVSSTNYNLKPIVDCLGEMTASLKSYLDGECPDWQKGRKDTPSPLEVEQIKTRSTELEATHALFVKLLSMSTTSWNAKVTELEAVQAELEAKKEELLLAQSTASANTSSYNLEEMTRLRESVSYWESEAIRWQGEANAYKEKLQSKRDEAKAEYEKKLEEHDKAYEALISEAAADHVTAKKGTEDELAATQRQLKELQALMNNLGDMDTQLAKVANQQRLLPPEIADVLNKLDTVQEWIDTGNIAKLKTAPGLNLLTESVYKSLPPKTLLNLNGDGAEFLTYAIGMQQKKVADTLSEFGLRVLNPSTGSTYNPDEQESDFATETIRVKEGTKHNTIERVLRIGYAWEDSTTRQKEILRTARVVRWIRMED